MAPRPVLVVNGNMMVAVNIQQSVENLSLLITAE